ncbi:MAG: hypothetical protein JWR75_1071 [Devosia sp.]|nr:hypothetical protein [Devosia sp.]
MKHEGYSAFVAALPDAPMAMPKQVLEPPKRFAWMFRFVFARLSRA